MIAFLLLEELFFSLVSGRSSVLTEPMRIKYFLVEVLTFAIPLHMSLVLSEGKHLDENHQELANPAVDVKAGQKDKALEAGAGAKGKGTMQNQSALLCR
jgi:hypothetical protein